MHFSVVVLLPLLCGHVLADQVPLKDMVSAWFDKAKAYVPGSHPIETAAAVIADKRVERINLRNWEGKLAPKLDTEEEWMIYVTGGNKSCFGRCGPVDVTWNESIPFLSALPKSTSAPLRLGTIDCEKEEVLCTSWGTSLPSVYHFQVSKQQPDGEAKPKTPLHVIPLNMTTTTVADIVSIPSSSKSRYLDYDENTGAMHPLDGWLHQFGLQLPFGYVMWAFAAVPSWMMMIGISFISRQVMSRRMAGGQGQSIPDPAAPNVQQAQTPSRPAPAAAPKSGGGKKRK